MSLDEEMFQFTEERTVSDADYKRVSDLTVMLQTKNSEIDAMEQSLSALKNERDRIKFGELPLAMDAIGMKKFSTADGEEIAVKGFVRCHIKEEMQEQSYAYLREMGAGPLIKNEIKISLPKGEDSLADEITAFLQGRSVAYSAKENIHWSTLNVWAKEQLEAGVQLQPDILGLHVGREATIKQKKA